MISVIVLVNDVENLDKCISSILMQTYSNFEVLCITNDLNGSELAIIEEFEKNYDMLKIFVNNVSKKKHVSKNIALRFCQGDYALFLDSDMILKENALEGFIETSKTNHADIFVYDGDKTASDSVFEGHYDKLLFNTDLDERFLFDFLNHDYYLFFNISFLRENNIYFWDDEYFKSNDLFFLNCIFLAEKLFFTKGQFIQTSNCKDYNKKENKLNINMFSVAIKNLLNNFGSYNGLKNEFWNFVFKNLFDLINESSEDNSKRKYFQDSKSLFDEYFSDKRYHEDICCHLDSSVLEFFNQSLDDFYYNPIKRDISKQLAIGNFSRLTIAIKSPNPIGGYEWGDYYFAVALKKSLEKKGFNVVIHEVEKWYGENDNEDIVFVLRGKKEYVPKKEHINIMWNISHPELISLEEYDLYDVVFIASVKYANIMSNKLTTLVKPLLQCTDPEVFYPNFNRDYSEEVLFVGSTRCIFREIIKDMLNTSHDFAVYGQGWDKFIDDRYIKGDFIPNNILNQYYSSCKILLNDHWEEMRELDFPSNRLFDALACGTFVISDDIESAATLFEDTIVTYENNDDLDKKIEYYLNNPHERFIKSEHGKKIVLSEHTFDNRVDEIIETIKNVSFN